MILRLFFLYFGLVVYGPAAALLIRSSLGLDPWNVLHQGISNRTPLSIGTVLILLGGVCLLLWIPLRQKPGLGTMSNFIVVGLSVDAALPRMPEIDGMAARLAGVAVAVIVIGIASAMYIGAGFGPGPRDGLMTGIVERTGWSLRVVRTALELAVLLIGWLLGGQIGLGTVAYALAIGPLIHFFLPYFEGWSADSTAAGEARGRARAREESTNII